MVLDPAQYLAASRSVHDRRPRRVDRFPDRLHCLSRARRREILRLPRSDRMDLFPGFDHAHLARIRHPAARHRHTRPGFPTPLGSTSPYRPLDNADLALRLRPRLSLLYDALSLVPAEIMPASLGLR